jgi:REP element-mobilizing transposase RayT
MRRQPRLDAPGTLYHIVGRGIETNKIFRNKKDREDFVDRLAELCRSGRWAVYAWALMPNHFHLLVRTRERFPGLEHAAPDDRIGNGLMFVKFCILRPG